MPHMQKQISKDAVPRQAHGSGRRGDQVSIKTLWGKRTEQYDGQYAPELLAAIDEYGNDENPDYMIGEYKKYLAEMQRDEFTALEEIDIEVDGERINAMLSLKTIPGKIKPATSEGRGKRE